MTSTREHLVDLETDTAVLAFAKHSRDAAIRAEADLLLAAVTWAERHPAGSIEDAATWADRGGDCPLPLGGGGAPLVAEFCIAEFAAVIGRPTIAGRIKIAHALELKYRLPRHWARVQAGSVEPWRACRIAATTLGLSPEAAAYVDAQVAPVAHKVGVTQLDRLAALAIETFMPDLAAENAAKAAEARHFTFFHHQVGSGGTTYLHGELDLADAHDLETAITNEAEALRLAGSTEPLDVRRAIAAGRIARAHLGLAPEGPDEATAPGKRQRTRQVVLYVHLSEAAITGTGTGTTGTSTGELAQVDNHHRTVTAEQVRTWCANPDTQVVVKPVIDLDQHIGVAAYEVPARLAEQAGVRDGCCVFPWCTRPATACDSEHVIPHADGGTTCSCNIAPVCRRHHRLKTHSPWTYTVIDPGTYLWTSPHGHQFLRDHHGTTDVTRGTGPPGGRLRS